MTEIMSPKSEAKWRELLKCIEILDIKYVAHVHSMHQSHMHTHRVYVSTTALRVMFRGRLGETARSQARQSEREREREYTYFHVFKIL